MTDPPIRFDDGAAYERMMGVWSQLAGEQFLDWLAPAADQRWVDVGCGNGAFTEVIARRCAPASVDGVDPSEGQLAFARTRPASRIARFKQGDAMALPYDDKTFDVATMALVIFFVPDPAKGVSEMARVVQAAALRPMRGTCTAVDFLGNRCSPNCARSAKKSCTRRVPMRHVSTRCISCGRMQASPMSRRERSLCNEPFRILMSLRQSA
jgi:ubiquinone/menaquinone biosynthesis C-methylase UbiE